MTLFATAIASTGWECCLDANKPYRNLTGAEVKPTMHATSPITDMTNLVVLKFDSEWFSDSSAVRSHKRTGYVSSNVRHSKNES